MNNRRWWRRKLSESRTQTVQPLVAVGRKSRDFLQVQDNLGPKRKSSVFLVLSITLTPNGYTRLTTLFRNVRELPRIRKIFHFKEKWRQDSILRYLTSGASRTMNGPDHDWVWAEILTWTWSINPFRSRVPRSFRAAYQYHLEGDKWISTSSGKLKLLIKGIWCVNACKERRCLDRLIP